MFKALPFTIAELRLQAEEQLRQVQVPCVDQRFALNGFLAEVIDQTESITQDDGYVFAFYLSRVVRNSAGEHFLLKTTDSRPYVKYLTQSRAKVVLKAKYVSPGGKRHDA